MHENDQGFGADILIYNYFPLESELIHILCILIKHALYTQSCIMARSRACLTVGQANLTVKRGCSHCKQCQEVERSGDGGGGGGAVSYRLNLLELLTKAMHVPLT